MSAVTVVCRGGGKLVVESRGAVFGSCPDCYRAVALSGRWLKGGKKVLAAHERPVSDHALLLSAIANSAGRVSLSKRIPEAGYYLCVDQRAFALVGDDDGCPVLTDQARAVLATVRG